MSRWTSATIIVGALIGVTIGVIAAVATFMYLLFRVFWPQV